MALECRRRELLLLFRICQSQSRLLLSSSRRAVVLLVVAVVAFVAAFLSTTHSSAPAIQQALQGNSGLFALRPQPDLISHEAQLWITAMLVYTKPKRWPWPYARKRQSSWTGEPVTRHAEQSKSAAQIHFSFDVQKNLLTDVLAEHAVLQREITLENRPLRALVARCHMGDTCGGIGDRLFGLAMLFLGAVLTGRAFFIDHQKPLPFEDFMEPNAIDWTVRAIQSPETRQTVLACSDGTICDFHSIRSNRAAIDQCPAVMEALRDRRPITVVYSNLRLACMAKMLVSLRFLPESLMARLKANQEVDLNQELRMWTTYVSHTLLNHLFAFSQRIRMIGDGLVMAAVGRQVPMECTVCIHLRSCKGIGETCVRHKVTPADFGQCGQVVEKQIGANKRCRSRMAWKVLTDDATAAATLRQYTNLSLVESNSVGRVLHLDKLNLEESLWRQGMDRVFVDFYLLSSCFYMVNSMSTLNEVASIFRGFAVERHDFDGNTACSGSPNVITQWERDTNTPEDRWRALQHVWII